MAEQAKTYYLQARLAIQSGDARKAMELLRRARLLAAGDPSMTAKILAEMIGIAPLVGCDSEQPVWQQQLSGLQPAFVSPNPSQAMSRWPFGLIGSKRVVRRILLLALLFGCVGVTGFGFWRFWEYSADRYEPAYGSKRIAPTTERERWLNSVVGMILHVQRCRWELGSETITIDTPLGIGTGFAIASDGVLLTNKHVVQVPESECQAVAFGKMIPEASPRIVACFGPQESDQFEAEVIHVSDSFDIAVLRVGKTFPKPLKLFTGPVVRQEEIVTYGFPARVMGFENGIIQAKFNEDFGQLSPENQRKLMVEFLKTTRHIKLTDSFAPSAFDPIANSGIISAPDRIVAGVRYHLFDARVLGGNSGGPLFRKSSDEVIGIVTLGDFTLSGSPLDSDPRISTGTNYALELSQLRADPILTKYLP